MVRLATTLVQIGLAIPAIIGLRWMYFEIKNEIKLMISEK